MKCFSFGIPFAMDCSPAAVIASMYPILSKQEVIDDAKFAYNDGEIDLSGYCKILKYLGL